MRTILTDGLVIMIEPMISAGSAQPIQGQDGWTIRTRDGSLSAHHEHTPVITAAQVRSNPIGSSPTRSTSTSFFAARHGGVMGEFVHELTHMFAFDIVPTSIRRDLPGWMHEGRQMSRAPSGLSAIWACSITGAVAEPYYGVPRRIAAAALEASTTGCAQW